MSVLGREQGHFHQLPSVPTDKSQTNYNVATEADDTNLQILKTEEDKKTERFEIGHQREIKEIIHKMFFLLREIGIMLFLAFTYAALTNDSPKISRSPPAFPFFSENSSVKDWYHGELSIAINKARESDISFIMFYAPWDAESQLVRQEFELAARYTKDHISFSAVNCWQPGSECQKQYTKAYRWPVLIVYLANGKGIQYKGPLTAPSMVKFLLIVSKPIIRLYTEEEVHGLLASYDAVVVGCMDAFPGNLNYSLFYGTALQYLEKDPYQEIAFAVLTGSKSNCFGATTFPSISLHLWNETLWYPKNALWKADAVLIWILNNFHQVGMWITPSESKSGALFSYIQPGPALILFTPRNPLDTSIDFYDLLHEVGLEYYNCDKKQHLALKSLLIHTKRIENLIKYTYLQKTCPLISKLDKHKDISSVITYAATFKWANSSCCLSKLLQKDSCSKCDDINLAKQHLFPTLCEQINGLEECLNVYQFAPLNKNINDRLEVILGKNHQTLFQNDILGDNDDRRSAENLQKFWKDHNCRIADLAQNINLKIFSDSISDFYSMDSFNKGQNIEGLACKTNGSLSLIAVDSTKYFDFAEKLGIDLSTKKDQTTAVIISEQLETHYIMAESLNDISLREFIYNFTVKNLPRSFNSLTSIKSSSFHSYSYKNSCKTRKPCILELTANTFLPTVMRRDKAVIVLYYSKQCSFCNGISYTLLSVSKIFSFVPSILFTRIDGDLNILPWEFTMDTYPTIIFFPIRRKAESRVFPSSLPVTVPNLVSFVLTNLHSSLKLQAMWSICNQTNFLDEKESCIASVRKENLSIINNTLRAWRNATLVSRTRLFYKLQQLRNLNLLLAHSPQNTKEIEKYLMRLHSPALEYVYQTKVVENETPSHIKDEL